MSKLQVDMRYSIEQMHGQFLTTGKAAGQSAAELQGPSFAEVLEQKKAEDGEGVRFSKHASERLTSRNIDLSDSQKERLNHAVKAAEAKGIKESLVMMDNLAFIINVKNNTVVTAVAGGEEKIFSNIDGAVVV
ncbi:MAG: flagellar protein [Lachnospiraceae bacterium]|nr:flagellar protein [Lachnospiraceae bacterium]